MGLHDLAPYLGRNCQVMVLCSTCGGQHTHTGTLSVAREPGEMHIGNARVGVQQIRALVDVPSIEPERGGIALPRIGTLLWALAAASLLTAWQLVSR